MQYSHNFVIKERLELTFSINYLLPPPADPKKPASIMTEVQYSEDSDNWYISRP
jgi:hypothetical protein